MKGKSRRDFFFFLVEEKGGERKQRKRGEWNAYASCKKFEGLDFVVEIFICSG